MPTYKLVSGSMSRWVNGKRVKQAPGDLVTDFTEAELESHLHRLVLVSNDPPMPVKRSAAAPAPATLPPVEEIAPEPEPEPEVPAPEPELEEEEYDWSEVLSGNVASVVEYINEALEDTALVKSLLAEERKGKARKSVVVAAEERIKALRVPKS